MTILRRVRRYLVPGVIFITGLFGLYETLLQFQEYLYIRSVALKVAQNAKAETPRERVLALQAYLQRTVSYHGAPYVDRPFFRASTGDILRSGKGYCGEDSRAFICLAHVLDIPARRIYLYGNKMHVVAEADLGPDEKVIVDCQNPPQIDDLESLNEVLARTDYDGYSTLNLRRLHLAWLTPRVELSSGFLSYLMENPHALQALLWFAIPAILLSVKASRLAWQLIVRRLGMAMSQRADALVCSNPHARFPAWRREVG